MRNVSDEISTENKNPLFMFNNVFYGNRTVCEIMWENMVEAERPQTRWVTKATNTH
jgi:hypothetical protein